MQKIKPYLWFASEAEEAANFYVSLFKNSKIEHVSYYSEAGPLPEGTVMTVSFTLDGVEFLALNGGAQYTKKPDSDEIGIALYVDCETQEDVDRLYDGLSQGGSQQPCGWVRDKYGFSWNLVPTVLPELLGGDDEAGAERAMRAMLQMKKIDIAALQRAYDGTDTPVSP